MKQTKKGFTLVELMIVIAIVGILAAFAYPAYTQYIKKAQCADGMDSLLSLAGRMEEFYLNNDSYVGATVGATGTVGGNQSSEGLYTLAVTVPAAPAGNFSYTLTATPTGTGMTLSLDSLGQMTEAAGATAGTNPVSCF